VGDELEIEDGGADPGLPVPELPHVVERAVGDEEPLALPAIDNAVAVSN
jgi:hypothetical protein